MRRAVRSPCCRSSFAAPLTLSSSTPPCLETSASAPPTSFTETSPCLLSSRTSPFTFSTVTPSNEDSTSAAAIPETSTRPCSLRTESTASGGASTSRCVSKPTSRLPRSSSSRFVPIRSGCPSPERRSSIVSAKAFAFSSVGWNTTLRSRTFTVPGAPLTTRTLPKALRSSIRGAAPATARSAACSNVKDGP